MCAILTKYGSVYRYFSSCGILRVCDSISSATVTNCSECLQRFIVRSASILPFTFYLVWIFQLKRIIKFTNKQQTVLYGQTNKKHNKNRVRNSLSLCVNKVNKNNRLKNVERESQHTTQTTAHHHRQVYTININNNNKKNTVIKPLAGVCVTHG